MEFSFDRAPTSFGHSSPKESPSSPHHPGGGAGEEENLTSQSANERLKKAIERNRAKQKEREAQLRPKVNAQVQSEEGQIHREHVNPSPLPNAKIHSQTPIEIQVIEKSRYSRPVDEKLKVPDLDSDSKSSNYTTSSSSATRRTVAKPETTEFAPQTTIRRPAGRVTSQVNYSTTTSGQRKKNKTVDSNLVTYAVKAGWIFSLFILGRLIFANGGIIDYYSQKKIVIERQNELKDIKDENMQLVLEIEKMKTDISYQKKLVRDNLGFIASDEYLVLFPKEK